MSIESHVHQGAVVAAPIIALSVAFFGTLHLLALSATDNRIAKAWLSLGF